MTADEAEVLRRVLLSIAVRRRTGEIGVVHGMNRFVSTNQPFKQQDDDMLNAAARKLGLNGIILFNG